MQPRKRISEQRGRAGPTARAVQTCWSLCAGRVANSMDLIWRIRKRPKELLANPPSPSAPPSRPPSPASNNSSKTNRSRATKKLNPARRWRPFHPPLPTAPLDRAASLREPGFALSSWAGGMAAPPQEQISLKETAGDVVEPIDQFHRRMRRWPDRELRPR